MTPGHVRFLSSGPTNVLPQHCPGSVRTATRWPSELQNLWFPRDRSLWPPLFLCVSLISHPYPEPCSLSAPRTRFDFRSTFRGNSGCAATSAPPALLTTPGQPGGPPPAPRAALPRGLLACPAPRGPGPAASPLQNWGTQRLSPTKSQAASERFMIPSPVTPAGQGSRRRAVSLRWHLRAAVDPAPDGEFRKMSSSRSASLNKFLERARKSGD